MIHTKQELALALASGGVAVVPAVAPTEVIRLTVPSGDPDKPAVLEVAGKAWDAFVRASVPRIKLAVPQQAGPGSYVYTVAPAEVIELPFGLGPDRMGGHRG